MDKSQDQHLIETRLDGEMVYKGAFLKIMRDEVRLPDGQGAIREYAVHPGAVMVIPLFDDGSVLLERQFRYPVGQVMVEFPAGKLDPNEGGLACARRELKEETGYSAREYVFLARIHPVISYSTEFIDIYLATGLTEGEANLDAGEFLEVIRTPFAELLEWIRRGDITDVKTLVGAFWLDKYLSGGWKPQAVPTV
ncbi:MAG: NUDIX hydrolase [Candidatus Protistobacter heckmanni]|nr:NUDIX hydrolase [Candidatus Protistobacter heckmanni]